MVNYSSSSMIVSGANLSQLAREVNAEFAVYKELIQALTDRVDALEGSKASPAATKVKK